LFGMIDYDRADTAREGTENSSICSAKDIIQNFLTGTGYNFHSLSETFNQEIDFRRLA